MLCLGILVNSLDITLSVPDFRIAEPPPPPPPPIGHLELLTIVVSIKLWKEKLKGKIITLYSDNETAVKAVANKRSSVPFMQACLRELFIVLALHNITLIVKHVPGKKNILADYLSRWHLKAHYRQQFLALTRDRPMIERKADLELFTFLY